MSETQPTGEQIRFRSANTGDHVLDTYLESAEIGGRTLTDLLDDLFDPSNNGVFRSDNFEFRFDSNKIQFRVGQFASSTAGFTDVTTFFAIKGTFSTSTAYNNFDVVTTSDKDVYIVHGLSTATTFSSESNFISSSNTTKIVDVSEAKDWAIKTDGIVSSTGYSAKAWAIGGTGVDNASSGGAAKDWATKTGGTVDGSDFSAKHYATTGNVATVAGAISNINTVAGISSNVTSVAGNSSNLNSAVSNASNINAAVSNASNINSAVSNASNINSVVSNASNINTVAGINTNVSTVATNISTVNSLAATLAGTQTFAVTVANPGSGNVFVIDGANNPSLSLIRGFTYTFDVSNSSNTGHPLRFKNGSTSYTTGVTVNGTPGQSGATVVFAVPTDAPASGLLYYCTVHGNGMGNSITTQDDDIAVVASLSSNINTVAGISSNITTVAGIETNLATVAGNTTNINTVAGISSNVTTVAGISSSISSAGANATLAQNYAIKVDGAVESSNYSSKAWAIGGTGVTDTAGSGSAKSWATEADAVDGTEHSAKSYAISGSAISAGSAKQWAIGGGTGFTTSTAVAGGVFSAKYYAEAAQSASASASGSLSSFQAVYLGSGSSNPSSGHTAGDLFFNTSDNKLKYFNGSAWISIEPSTGVTQGQALAFAIAL